MLMLTHRVHRRAPRQSRRCSKAAAGSWPRAGVVPGTHPSLAYTRGQSGSVASATTKVCRRPASTFVSWPAGAGSCSEARHPSGELANSYTAPEEPHGTPGPCIGASPGVEGDGGHRTPGSWRLRTSRERQTSRKVHRCTGTDAAVPRHFVQHLISGRRASVHVVAFRMSCAY